MVTIDDFLKLEFKVGTVLEAEPIEASEKLIKLKVDLGPLPVISSISEESPDESTDPSSQVFDREAQTESAPQDDEEETSQDDNVENAEDEKHDIRQILAGIKQWYSPEDLVGKQFIIIANLEPRKMMGMESQGMLLAADGEKPIPLTVFEKVRNGAKIR